MQYWVDGAETSVFKLQHPIPYRSHFAFVDVTPTPVFARFERLDDRVTAGKKMFARVAVRRGVATADVAARET